MLFIRDKGKVYIIEIEKEYDIVNSENYPIIIVINFNKHQISLMKSMYYLSQIKNPNDQEPLGFTILHDIYY